MSQEDFKKALNYAFLLLKYRARSASELNGRLKKKKYLPEVIAQVQAYLVEHGFINDAEFVRMYAASCREKGWGPLKIKAGLVRSGIGRALYEPVLSELDDNGPAVRRLIQRKLKTLRARKGKKTDAAQKILRFLLGRGFDYQECMKAMQEMEVVP